MRASTVCAHPYAEISIFIRDQQCREKYVAEHWCRPWVGQIEYLQLVSGIGRSVGEVHIVQVGALSWHHFGTSFGGDVRRTD
jgi:hypothetical protein